MRARLLPVVLLAACPRPAGDDDDGAGDDDDSTAADYDAGRLPQGDPPIAPPRRAMIDHVVDGDTADVILEGGAPDTVRFLSVDTPELHPNGSDTPECYAITARDHTRSLLPEGTIVWLTFDGEERDFYDRLLAYVFVGERPDPGDHGLWVNLGLVEDGYGTAYIWDDNETFRDLFLAAEAEARGQDRGMWGACAR
jgi:micrococcal nuclease